MITCKNDRLLELLWFVGYCIEFPTQLAVRIGGGAEWNRRVMYRAIREGYVRLYRKKHKRHVIRSMSLTQKGFEYVAQRDPEALSMIYSRVNSSERVYPGWIDKILRLHAIAIGTVMSNAAGATLLISQKPSLMSPAKRATNAVVPDSNKIYYYAAHELRVAIEEYSLESVSKSSRTIGIIVKGRCCFFLYFTGSTRMYWMKNSEENYVEAGKCAQIEWENSAVTGQIQVRKYSADDNLVTGQRAGSALEGAVFEITQARSGKVVGYIVTDARGVAASDPLPLGRYFVTEVSAPKYYQLSSEKMEAEIEYPNQIIKLSAYNKSANLGVTIKKSGNYEVQSGQTMSYDFSGIANTSNVALNHFFWHDRIPTDATRALSISTGTYNARLYYKVTFKTNLNDYRTLASNLLTSNNYSLSLNAATLRLAQGEYVTDVRFEFGTVPSGFSSVVKPTMRVQVLGTVSNGYQIINRADVGGQYLNEWQTAKTTWVTTVRRFNTTPLPKTGY